ncbi:hypothetical protein ACFY2M_32865, partial [Streptomyces sp. NPDC001276]
PARGVGRDLPLPVCLHLAQVFGWLRRKHRRSSWKSLRRRYSAGRWWPADDEVTLFKCAKVRTHRYLYRGNRIPSPWPNGTTIAAAV